MPTPLSRFSIKCEVSDTAQIELYYDRPIEVDAELDSFLLDFDFTIIVRGVYGFEDRPMRFIGMLDTLRRGMNGYAHNMEICVEHDEEDDQLRFMLSNQETGLLLEYQGDRELYQEFLDVIDGKLDPEDSGLFDESETAYSTEYSIEDIR